MTRRENRTPVLSARRVARPRAGWRGELTAVFLVPGLALTALLILPLVALVWRALEGGVVEHALQPTALSALWLSVLTSALSTLVAVLGGTPLAYGLLRWPHRGRAWLDLLIDLPVVLPPAAAGLALLMTFGRRGLLGGALAAAGLELPFTTAAVVVAQTFVSAPLYVRAARIGFGGIDPQLEEAALVEGATGWQSFRYVALPLARRGLVGGALLCWARALGEFGATILFAGSLPGRTQTMPLAIYLRLESDLGVALTLSLILLVVSAILLAVLRWLEEPRDASLNTG